MPLTTTSLPGDFNHDGTVDAADNIVWRKNPGGICAQDDYNTWRANFGATLNPGLGATAGLPSSAIPEPSTLALVIAFSSTVLLARRRSN